MEDYKRKELIDGLDELLRDLKATRTRMNNRLNEAHRRGLLDAGSIDRMRNASDGFSILIINLEQIRARV